MSLPMREQAKYWGVATLIFFVLLWYLGSVILPFVVGQFFTTVGPHVLYYVVFLALTIDCAIFVVLIMKYQTRTTK